MKKQILLAIGGLLLWGAELHIAAHPFEVRTYEGRDNQEYSSAQSSQGKVPTKLDYQNFKNYIKMNYMRSIQDLDHYKQQKDMKKVFSFFEGLFRPTSMDINSSHIIDNSELIVALHVLCSYMEEIGNMHVNNFREKKRKESLAGKYKSSFDKEYFYKYAQSDFHQYFKIFQYIFKKIIVLTEDKEEFEGKYLYGKGTKTGFIYLKDKEDNVVPVLPIIHYTPVLYKNRYVFEYIPYGKFKGTPAWKGMLTLNGNIIPAKGWVLSINTNSDGNLVYEFYYYEGAPLFNYKYLDLSPDKAAPLIKIMDLRGLPKNNKVLFIPRGKLDHEDLFAYYFLNYIQEHAQKKDIFALVLQEVLKAEVDVEKEEDKRFEKIVSSLKDNLVEQEIAKNKAYRKAIEEEQQKRLEMVKKGTTPGKKKSKKKRKGKGQRISRTAAKVVSVKERITPEIMRELDKKHHTYKDFAGTLFKYLKNKGIKEVREIIKGSHHKFHIEGEVEGETVNTGFTLVKPHGKKENKISHRSIKRTVAKLAASLSDLFTSSEEEGE